LRIGHHIAQRHRLTAGLEGVGLAGGGLLQLVDALQGRLQLAGKPRGRGETLRAAAFGLFGQQRQLLQGVGQCGRIHAAGSIGSDQASRLPRLPACTFAQLSTKAVAFPAFSFWHFRQNEALPAVPLCEGRLID